MENNKLIKTKEGIFRKIFNKIKLFFCKKTEIHKVEEEKNIKTDTNIKKELKVELENNDSYQKEQFMKEITNNPILLEKFSIERLEKIRDYYKDCIKKKEEILYKMKKV